MHANSNSTVPPTDSTNPNPLTDAARLEIVFQALYEIMSARIYPEPGEPRNESDVWYALYRVQNMAKDALTSIGDPVDEEIGAMQSGGAR